MSTSNIPGYSAFQTDVNTILKQLVGKINGYVTSLAANPATKSVAQVAAPSPLAGMQAKVAPAAPAAPVAPPPGLTPQQAENFTKLNPVFQGNLAKAPLGIQQMTLNTMGAAIARGFTIKIAETVAGTLPPPMQEKLAALPIETQNKVLDAVGAALTAALAASAAVDTPQYEKLAAEAAKLKNARDAIFEETGLTTKKAVVQPAPVAPVAQVSNICGTLGKPSADGKIRIYTRDECEGTLKGDWNEGGECLKKEGNSYSYDCRYLNTLPEPQRGGRRTKRARKMKLRKTSRKAYRR